jgi:ATP-dependent DNA helicase RecG
MQASATNKTQTFSKLRMDTQIQFLKGVGPKLGEILRKKGIATVQDLLEWYPRAYEDRRAARNIASLQPDELVSLKAQVLRVSSFNMGKSKRKIYDVTLRDATGKIHCKFFRVPYKGYFERFQPGQTVRVIGKVTYYRGQIEFHHPDLQDEAETGVSVDGAADASESPEVRTEAHDDVLPIYPETEGLTTRQLMRMIASVFAQLKPQDVVDLMPKSILTKYSLPTRFAALQQIHQPPKDAGKEFVEQKSPSHQRIIFEEFFWLELYLASRRAGLQREQAPAFQKDFALVKKLTQSLPFELTKAQRRAFLEIAEDLSVPHPMHRLVQGDVGSGKTLVALMSSLLAVQNGFQAAIMVPTELLAEQHYQNAKKYLEPLGITVGLLTGQMKAAERKQTYELLKSGVIQVCIGTHALIQDAVEFDKLGLVIIDEQHRFGVHQRSLLKQKGQIGDGIPHFLVMTATPIPRTLAMTVYGDLEVSVIDELPPGRTPIVTRVTYESARPKVIGFLKEQIRSGRQAYIVYPLVEESEKIDLKDAISQFERLKAELPEFKIALLHGKMKNQEKEDVMREFRSGAFQILVATTVIEVGVDVPNANLMLIEHSERFGLSQLHQLRGRVGRGAHKSYCVLMLGRAVSEESRARTAIMEKTSDGFKIAEADLEIRGPGEFLGARQSGLPGFKMANLVRDVQILQNARNSAFDILKRDPQLLLPEHQSLRSELLRTHGPTALASVG